MSSQQETLFIDVILPLPLPGLFTYRVPKLSESQITLGCRVLVQFGKKKYYSALIRNIHNSPPRHYEAKYLLSVIDEQPVVTLEQFAFWDWLSQYYMCTLGEVMAGALPSVFRLQSETRIVANQAAERDLITLSNNEFLVMEALELRKTLTLQEITKITELKSVFPLIRGLMDKGHILLEEELHEKFRPKIKSIVQLGKNGKDEKAMPLLFDELEKRAPKQLTMLMWFFKLTREKNQSWIDKSEFLKQEDASTAVLNGLIKKEILEVSERRQDRMEYTREGESPVLVLSEDQQKAVSAIREIFKEREVAYLHGVTSSGKTEVYIQVIREFLEKGSQVLYLLPEIALTVQMITRLKAYFGNSVLVYHSKFNEQERAEVWEKLMKAENNKEPYVVLGARSALFLPFHRLGLIVIDEEHENSYKQVDVAPRYHARDAAIYRANQLKAKVILGSATPSLESYWNCKEEKYGLVRLYKRFGDVKMPEVVVVNLSEERKNNRVKEHFSQTLLDHISHCLEQKEQVILFQNRRGYAPVIECTTCAWVPTCKNCDVSLTYHKHSQLLKCHYCGYAFPLPERCPACTGPYLKMLGVGTERVEDDLQVFIPTARIARMDVDTTKGKNAINKLIESFEDQEIDILVGTQMVTKGLDFGNVATVGILNADSLLHFPDFRAFERTYQLLTQVSGRAGRRSKPGKVVIQTSQPGHLVIQTLVSADAQTFYEYELSERLKFKYPPFYRLVEVTLKTKNFEQLNSVAADFARWLNERIGNRLIGPEFPLVAKVRNQYLKQVLIKIEKKASVSAIKKVLAEGIQHFKGQKGNGNMIFQVDVDPF